MRALGKLSKDIRRTPEGYEKNTAMTFSAIANLKDNIKTIWDKLQTGSQGIMTKHRMKREP